MVVLILGGALERRPASLNQEQIHLPKQQQLTNQPIPKPNRRLNSQRLALQTPVGAQARERKGLERPRDSLGLSSFFGKFVLRQDVAYLGSSGRPCRLWRRGF